MRLIGIAINLMCACTVLVTGCYSWGPAPVEAPDPVPHDPSAFVSEFSYSPAGPIPLTDQLILTARLNKPIDPEAGYVMAFTGDINAVPSAWNMFHSLGSLNDAGYAPDEVAGDGIYTGYGQWPKSAGIGNDLPMFSRIRWRNGRVSEAFSAPPIEVLPKGDPMVMIVGFTYAPSGRAEVGGKLTFSVELDRTIRDNYSSIVSVEIGDAETPAVDTLGGAISIRLNDDGTAPDETAGDKLWSGELVIPDDIIAHSELPVSAHYGTRNFSGPDLRIYK